MTETTSLKNILKQLTPAKAWGLVVASIVASVAIFSAGFQVARYIAQIEKERTITSYNQNVSELKSKHQREMEAVRSSNTVAPGIAAMRTAHRQTIILLYEGLIEDINRFIDDVYRPYFVRNMVEQREFEFMKAIIARSVYLDTQNLPLTKFLQFL